MYNAVILESNIIRYSVTAITLRFHRRDRGSTPRIGENFLVLLKIKYFLRINN